MNREIKFRGKDIQSNKWVYGNLIIDNKGNCKIVEFDNDGNNFEFNVNSDTVGQFSGFKDKNDKEMYEGDVFALPANGSIKDFEAFGWEPLYPRYVRLVAVAYGLDGFGFCSPCHAKLKNPDISAMSAHDRMYNIGNIYDNPELMEEKL